MTTRRPPPPTTGDPTALFDRPTFGDGNGGDDTGDRDDGGANAGDAGGESPFDGEPGVRPDASGFDDDDELTDPGIVPAHMADEAGRAQTATLRLSIDDLDDLDDLDALAISLPDAHVEEHDVSDLDGDVAASGAPTAIMQLPPEMLAHHIATDGAPPPSDDSDGAEPVVAFRRWSAGGTSSSAASTAPAAAAGPAAPPSPPVLDAPPRSPAAPPPVGPSAWSAATAPTLARAATVASTPAAMKRLVDEALKSVTAAQSCLDDDGTPASVQRAQTQLARAVAALARLGDELG